MERFQSTFTCVELFSVSVLVKVGSVGAGRVELAGEFAVVVHTPAFWKAWRPRIAESLPIGTASNT